MTKETREEEKLNEETQKCQKKRKEKEKEKEG